MKMKMGIQGGKWSRTNGPGRDGDRARRLDRSVGGFFRDAMRLSLGDPRRAVFFANAALHQRRAAARRRMWQQRGVRVPPLMIVSVTRTCNLRCAGCFVQAQGATDGCPMDQAELRRLLRQARDLGVSVIALAGGEPLTRPDILETVREFPQLQFIMITNGSLVDEDVVEQLERTPNLIPVVSLEGLQAETDGRRGGGVYERALAAMAMMRDRGVFFGSSIMVTRANFALVTSRCFVRRLSTLGSRLFFYVDYVPIEPGTAHMVPSAAQRNSEALSMSLLRAEFPGIFLSPSASEQAFGGCLAAGEGFIHVSPEGSLEPCPFAPFSDSNVRTVSLREALASPLMRRIRESDEHLTESEGGCALWSRREWVASLMRDDKGRPDEDPFERLVA